MNGKLSTKEFSANEFLGKDEEVINDRTTLLNNS